MLRKILLKTGAFKYFLHLLDDLCVPVSPILSSKIELRTLSKSSLFEA